MKLLESGQNRPIFPCVPHHLYPLNILHSSRRLSLSSRHRTPYPTAVFKTTSNDSSLIQPPPCTIKGRSGYAFFTSSQPCLSGPLVIGIRLWISLAAGAFAADYLAVDDALSPPTAPSSSPCLILPQASLHATARSSEPRHRQDPDTAVAFFLNPGDLVTPTNHVGEQQVCLTTLHVGNLVVGQNPVDRWNPWVLRATADEVTWNPTWQPPGCHTSAMPPSLVLVTAHVAQCASSHARLHCSVDPAHGETLTFRGLGPWTIFPHVREIKWISRRNLIQS